MLLEMLYDISGVSGRIQVVSEVVFGCLKDGARGHLKRPEIPLNPLKIHLKCSGAP